MTDVTNLGTLLGSIFEALKVEFVDKYRTDYWCLTLVLQPLQVYLTNI